MTINKIGLSVIAAAMLSTAGMAAGSLALESGSPTKVGQELLHVQVVEANLTTPLVYTNGMTAASATEPGFEIAFPGLNPAGVFTNLQIIDENNVTVANNSRKDGTTKIIFDAVGQSVILRNADYKLVSLESNTSIGDNDLSLLLPIDTTSVTAELTLWNNNGNPVPIDTATGIVMNATAQFALTIDTPLSAEIDAAAEFLTFSGHTTATSTNTTEDAFDFTITNLEQDTSGIWAAVTNMDLNVTAVSDVNLSNDVQTIIGDAIMTGTVSNNTINYTVDAAGGADDNITETTLTDTTEVTAMQATTFSATAYATISNGGGAVIPFGVNTNAGAWTIYGYNAQIPGASSSTFTDTVVTIVNTQPKGTDAVDAYFTIIDTDGNECTLNSTQGFDSVAAAAPSSNNKYKLSEMLVDCGSAVSGTAYAIEVTVPTTPTDIYSQAAVLNTAAGRDTKALPVYNNANSY